MGFQDYLAWIGRVGIFGVLRSCWNVIWNHGIQRILFGVPQTTVAANEAFNAREQPPPTNSGPPRRNLDQLHRRPLHERNEQRSQSPTYNIVESKLNQVAMGSSDTTYAHASIREAQRQQEVNFAHEGNNLHEGNNVHEGNNLHQGFDHHEEFLLHD
ncbi:uncharacterized protein LOC120333308 isoform X2 [Styela clava]